MAQDELISEYVDLAAIKAQTNDFIAELERVKKAYTDLANSKLAVQGSQTLPDMSSNVRKATIDTQNYIKTQQQLVSSQRAQIQLENELIKQAQLKAKVIADNARGVEKTSKANTAALKKEAVDAESVSNDYKQLSLAYNDAALKAKNLQIVLGANHPIAVQATKDATEQGEYLKKLDESVGQHQRNVGNYSSALTGYANTLRGLRGPTKLLGEALGIGAQEADQFRIVLEHSIQGIAAFFRGKERKAAATGAETAATEANTAATLQNNAAQQAAENIPQRQTAGASTATPAATNGASIAATEADTVAIEANIAAHQESNAVLAQSIVTTEAEAVAQAELLAASAPTAIALQAETVANAEVGVTAGAAAIGLKAEAIATTEVAVATTVASGAMRAFRVAVAATGIGLLLVAIGLIIYKIVEYRKSLAEANEMTKLFADVNADAAKSAGKEAGSLQVLKGEIENVLIPMDKRLQAIKNLKDQYPDLLKNTTDEALLQGKAAASYDLVAASILKKAQAQAAEAKIQELVSANLEIELKNDAIAEATNKKIRETKEDVTIASGGSFGGGNYGGASKAAKQKAILDEYNDIKAGNEKLVGLNNAKIQSLLKLAAVEENIAKDPDKKEKAGAKTLDSAKELLDAEFEAYKKSQTEKIAILADEVKDTKLSYDQRLQAQKDYTDASIDLTEAKAVQDIKKSNEKEAVLKGNLSKETGTQKSNTLIEIHNLEVEKQNIRSQAAIDERTELRKNEEVINTILQEQAKHYLEIQRNKYNAALKLIEEQTNKEKTINDNQYNEGVDGLNARLAKGEISQRQYNHKKLDLDFDYVVASLAIEEDRIRKLIALRAIFGEDVSKELLSLAELERKIREASLKHTIKTEEEKRKEIVKTLNTIKDVSTEVFNLIGGALNASAVTQKNVLKRNLTKQKRKRQGILNL